MTEPLQARLARLRLVSLDCDGVMTDGALYYAADGSELRRFNVRDGVGIKALLAAGIEVAIVTASRTPAIAHRAAALGVRHCLAGVESKLEALTALCESLGIALGDVAHVGDDVNDIALLKAVGLPMTVADAVPEVQAIARYITRAAGGAGAGREIAELVLAARAGIQSHSPPVIAGLDPAISGRR